MDMYCQFCGGKADFITRSNNRYAYRCPLCGALIPCNSKGRPFKNKRWRSLKQLELAEQCHELLDTLYSSPKEKQELYRYLAKSLKVPMKYCHFSMLSNDNMRRAKVILTEIQEEKRSWKS